MTTNPRLRVSDDITKRLHEAWNQSIGRMK